MQISGCCAVRTIGVVALAGAVAAGGCAHRPGSGGAGLPRIIDVREYVIPWENPFPTDMALDTAGRLWFTERLTHSVAVLDPETGGFRSFRTPTERSAPYGMLSAPDGGIWFAASMAGTLGRVDPATGDIVEYPLADARGGPHLLAWHDGEIWFGLRESRGYGRFDTRTGQAQLFYLERARPYSLAVAGGSIWMSSFGEYRLLQVDAATGAVRVHELSGVPRLDWAGEPQRHEPLRRWQGEVRRLAADGCAVWFTDFVRSSVVQFDPVAGELRAYGSLEAGTEPYGIARSSRGIIWYGERGGNRITALHPGTADRLRVAIPTPGSFARQILIDEARRRVWFTLSDIGRIGVIEYR
jgi:virginiamycin B lyase